VFLANFADVCRHRQAPDWKKNLF